MNARLNETMATWHLEPGADMQAQIEALLEQLLAAGLLRASACAVFLGEQYHLGGVEDTRRMVELLSVTAADRVVDLACYIGGPARQLAREYGCEVVGVDISPVHIAIAERLTDLVGQELGSCPVAGTTGQKTSFCPTNLRNRVRFICASADAVPLADASFTVAWSQGSFPSDLSWLNEIHRLLVPGGRLAFTGFLRRECTEEPGLDPYGLRVLSLEEMVARVEALGFRVVSAEDISEWELERGWLPARKKLEDDEARYRDLLGEEWVRRAYRSLDDDIAAWRSGRAGNGRVVAVKE